MNTLPKAAVVVLSFALGTTLLAWRAQPSAPADSLPRVEETVERTGQVDGWHVLANGTVAVHLVGKVKDQPFASWLVTPGDKGQSTRFEDQVLYTVLHYMAAKEELTFAIGLRNEKTDKTGKSIKEAIPIEAMMVGVLPSEEVKDKKGAPTTHGK